MSEPFSAAVVPEPPDEGEIDLFGASIGHPGSPSQAPAPSAGPVEVEGTVDHILYHDEKSPFTVARVQSPSGPVTVVGAFEAPRDAVSYRFMGEWVQHPTYGRQLAVHWLEEALPTRARGIERYLASARIKGVGKKLACKLVEAFGDDTFRIIEEAPERLIEVKGLTAEKQARIVSFLEAHRATRRIFAFLASFGITPALASKIHREFGARCIDEVRRNPYQMADRIAGVGFKISDGVAQKMGLASDDPFRLRAGLLHALRVAQEDGHFFLPREVLLTKAAQLLDVEPPLLEEPLERAAAAGRVVVEDDAVYLRALYRLEIRLAAQVRQRCALRGKLEPGAERMAEIGRALGDIQLAELQLACLRRSLSAGIFIMTGGPGTGKTTTVRGILELCRLEGLQAVLAAPTGRASRRMTEATGREAKTLHRLLEYAPTEHLFKRDAGRPLKADVVIVDEMSMVDAWLFSALLEALPERTHLVLVGDVDQLPSVGAGCILRDLIDSDSVPVVFLNEIFRQGEGSLIVQNSHRINRGEKPLRGHAEGDFFFMPEESAERVAEKIIELCHTRLPRHYGFDPRRDIQVIAPMYRGAAGVTALNAALQACLNPLKDGEPSVPVSNGRAGVGDKVMQLRNNYDKGIFNGDMGIIGQVDDEERMFTMRLLGPVQPSDERDGAPGPEEVEYGFDEAHDLALAYACTIHKSQGSEFPAVVIPVTTQHYVMLQRNLLYTAVTRARKLAVLLGSHRALDIAVKNDVVVKRYTRLSERLNALQDEAGSTVMGTEDPQAEESKRPQG